MRVSHCWLVLIFLACPLCAEEPAIPAAPKPSREQTVTLRWYQSVWDGAYHKVGRRNVRWDSPVDSATFLIAEGLAEVPAAEPRWRELAVELADAALREGCNDPMVRFAARRFRPAAGRVERRSAEVAADWVAIAEALSASGYPPNLKFHAEMEAAAALRSAMPSGTNTWPDIHRHRHAAMNLLLSALADKTTPTIEVTEMVMSERRMVRSNPKQLAASWAQIEPLLRRNWPRLPLADLIDGQLAIEAAWKARGSGTIDTVTESGYRKFTEELEKADQLLTRAWEQDKSNPVAPTKMLTVCLGLQKDGGEMEKWFQRAMEARPGYFPALRAKLEFLTPKWGGSVNALRSFGRQCLKEPTWGDEAPLIVIDVHRAIAAAHAWQMPPAEAVAVRAGYWRGPGVWDEVREALDEVHRRRPNDVEDHNSKRATWSLRCGAWDEFLRVAPALSPAAQKRLAGTNTFEGLVAEVRSRAGGK